MSDWAANLTEYGYDALRRIRASHYTWNCRRERSSRSATSATVNKTASNHLPFLPGPTHRPSWRQFHAEFGRQAGLPHAVLLGSSWRSLGMVETQIGLAQAPQIIQGTTEPGQGRCGRSFLKEHPLRDSLDLRCGTVELVADG
jgi:hypothetical protein